MRIKELLSEEIINEVPLPSDWDPEEFGPQSSFKRRLKYAFDRAKKIGKGSSRVALIIDYEGRPTVLKLAMNRKGLLQNVEDVKILGDSYFKSSGVFIPLIDFDKDNTRPTWIHTELAKKTSEQQLCKLIGCEDLIDLHSAARFGDSQIGKNNLENTIKRLKNKGKTDEDIGRFLKYVQVLRELERTYNIMLGDFIMAGNWGIYKGKPVIIDTGLSKTVWDYYIKKSDPWKR